MSAVLKLSLYEQLLALPEHVTGEILNGELYAMPRPRHALSIQRRKPWRRSNCGKAAGSGLPP